MSDNTYDLKPSKDAYQAVKSDVTPVSAFKELIDNALDNWRRVLDGLDPVNIDIEYHDGGPDQSDEIVIRDDSGGVEEDDLHILFALGQSNKENINGSIGAYGVGAKKAIVNLGNSATIKSRHLYAETGFGFSIDEDWLTNDDDWTVDKVEYNDVDKGVTEIRVSDLNTPWEKYRDNLEYELRQTYQHFLGTDRMGEMEPVSITIREFDMGGETTDVTEVEPPEPVDWTYTPMDDLYARRYESIDLESKEFDATVTLNVTVGLMQKANSEKSGADIYCQNRQVLRGVKDERAGFGTGSGSSRLGKFSGQHERLRVVIEFETDGDARVLPWDAQKSDVDPYNRVSRAAFDWIRRIVKPYYTAAGAYDKIPTSLTRPYDRDNEYSVTDGLDDPLDYSGRERVTHRPDTSWEQAKAITDRADSTAPLRLYSPGGLPDELEPAYREEFLRLVNSEFGVRLDEDDSLPTEEIPEADVPEDMIPETARETYEHLRMKAEEHATREPPVRGTGFDEWQQTLYDLLLSDALEEYDIEAVLDDLDTIEDEEDETSFEAGTDTTSEDDGVEKFGTEDHTADEDGTQETIAGLSGSDGDSEIEGSAEDTDGTSVMDATEPAEASDGDDSEQSGVASNTAITEDAMQHSLNLSEEEWETLVDALGLDEDASAEEVRERLFDTMDTLRKLPTA